MTTNGAYTYHVFKSSGTFTVASGGAVDVLAVAGGGGGASGVAVQEVSRGRPVYM